MSKKTKEVATLATISGEALKELFEKYENVSIRRFAEAVSINYNMLLKASKRPIEGVPYNPNARNYDEIAKMLNRREIDLNTIDWEALNELPTRAGATLSKDIAQFNVGDEVYLRDNNEVPYEILYKTDTHIVIMLKGSSEPRALSHNTFFFKGPSFEPRTITKKVSAEETEEA